MLPCHQVNHPMRTWAVWRTLVGHAANKWDCSTTAAAPLNRRCRARWRRSRRWPSHTNGVGSAFQPATVSSSHVMISVGVCGCCPSKARRTLRRWSAAARFSQEPLNGAPP